MSRDPSSARRQVGAPLPVPNATQTLQPRLVQPTPAQLASFAIYNPSLGPTDETLEDQIVFETSRKTQSLNEKLRQIGLAQGMVQLSRGFAKKGCMDTYLTRKTRVIVKEVEKGWWILVHIDLTSYPSQSDPTKAEYTPRDLSPPEILLAQVDSAYSEYVLLHGTFHDGYGKGRTDFMKGLSKFWKYWCWNWEVLLSADPADNIQPKAIRNAKPSIAGNLTASIKAFEDKWKERGLDQMTLYRVPKPTEEEPIETQPQKQTTAGWSVSYYLWPTYTSPPKTTPAAPKFLENTFGTLYTTTSEATNHCPTLWNLTRSASQYPKASYLTTGGNAPIKKRRKRQEPNRQRRSESVSRMHAPSSSLKPPPSSQETRNLRSASVGPWNRRSLPPPPPTDTSRDSSPSYSEPVIGETWMGYLTFGINALGITPLWASETNEEPPAPLPVPPPLFGLPPPPLLPPPPISSPPLPPTTKSSTSSSKKGSLLIPAAIPLATPVPSHLVLYSPPSPPPPLPATGDPFEPPVETRRETQSLIYTLLFTTQPSKQTIREIDRDLSLIASYPDPSLSTTGSLDAVSSLNAVKPVKFEFSIKDGGASKTSTFPTIPELQENGYDESGTRQDVCDLWRGFLAVKKAGGGRVRVRGRGGGGWWIEWDGTREEGRGGAGRCRV